MHDLRVVAQPQVDGVGQINQLKHRLQQVIAIIATAHHVQKQIEFGGRRIGLPAFRYRIAHDLLPLPVSHYDGHGDRRPRCFDALGQRAKATGIDMPRSIDRPTRLFDMAALLGIAYRGRGRRIGLALDPVAQTARGQFPAGTRFQQIIGRGGYGFFAGLVTQARRFAVKGQLRHGIAQGAG